MIFHTIFASKKLKTILIKEKDNNTIIKSVIQVNLKNSYCSEQYHSLKRSYETKSINFFHFSDFCAD